MEDYEFINIVGYGYVGSAVGHLCKRNKVAYCVMDANKETVEKETMKVNGFTEVEELVVNSEQHNNKNVYFIAVPTPSSISGECNIGIVDSVVCDIARVNTKETYILIKSTLKPGTCKQLQEKYGRDNLSITYCPEFLKEKTFEEDMYNANFVLLGNGNQTVENVMKKLYAHNTGIKVVCKSYEECELFKYTINVYLAVKVWYFNEVNVLCEKYLVNYNSLKELFDLEPRLGDTHLDVPGHDGNYGFGGKCLPKETRGMHYLQKTLGIDNEVLGHILKRNEVFRNIM
jgi:UDPglucose 6-dehydrogenase